jgi:hypothetical protein
MKKNKEETVKCQYRRVKETKELIIVYVNYTKFKRWYEGFSLYDYMYFDTDKNWLLEKTVPANPSEYVELTRILIQNDRIEPNSVIVNRLPSLK